MKMEYIQSYCSLEQELDQARNTLITLNDNIRRIVGRDPKDVSRGDKHSDFKRNDAEKLGSKDNGSSAYKRRNLDSKSVFNRLSAPPQRNVEELKPRLNSRVTRELPSRQEIVAAQCSDAESRARNRRMFGSLLGTLQKFCLEESRLKQKEDKKAKVEKKLEEQEKKEKENMRKQRELLFLDRKRKQMEIRKLELKMSRLKDYEIWEASQKHLKGHIKTKTKPYIYFRPRVMSKATESLLSDSRSLLKKEMNKKMEAINKEIAEIENRFKIHEDEPCGHHINNAMQIDSVPAIVENNVVVVEKKDEINGSTQDEPSDLMDEVQIKIDTDCKENNSMNVNESITNSSVVTASEGSPKDTKLLE